MQDGGSKALSQTDFRIYAGLAGPGVCILNKDCAGFEDQMFSEVLLSCHREDEARGVPLLLLHLPLTGPLLIQPWNLATFLDPQSPSAYVTGGAGFTLVWHWDTTGGNRPSA